MYSCVKLRGREPIVNVQFHEEALFTQLLHMHYLSNHSLRRSQVNPFSYIAALEKDITLFY